MEQFKIDGLKEVEEALKDLDPKLQAQIYRTVNRKGVKKYIVDNLKSLLNYSARTESGIALVNDPADKTAVYGGVTGRSYWLRFADRGTAKRQTSKGANRGSIVGKKQIQPAILNSVDDLVKYMNEEIGTEVEKILTRRIKSTQKKIAKL